MSGRGVGFVAVRLALALFFVAGFLSILPVVIVRESITAISGVLVRPSSTSRSAQPAARAPHAAGN